MHCLLNVKYGLEHLTIFKITYGYSVLRDVAHILYHCLLYTRNVTAVRCMRKYK